MSEGVGTVEAKKLELKLPEGGFKLETGGVLKRIVVQYEECGAPIGEFHRLVLRWFIDSPVITSALW